jgi:tRNA threonylcarbamoyladenosine biosynthesis protein TsaE
MSARDELQILDEKEIASLAEFRSWARSLAKYVKPRSIFLLKGELGVGKTELVKSLVSSLAVDGALLDVVSPTFALQHSYETKKGHIDHWDLYRLTTEDELESSGFWDQLMSDDYCLWIEWPERFPWKYLPRNAQIYVIEISFMSPQKDADQGRMVKVSQLL